MHVCDPAAGTGGFLLAAYEQMKSATLDPDEKRFLRDEALRGWEIVDATARLCAMNLLLHGISAPESGSPITVDDSLRSAPSQHFDMVLTNPPFGTQVVLQGHRRGRRDRHRDDELPARGLLGNDFEQATQLPSARPVAADYQRSGGHRRAGQCAVRRWRRRDHPPEAAGAVRCAHPAATADRHLLRRRSQGERAVLRPQATVRVPLDGEAVDLRLPHQPELHPEDTRPRALRSRRFRRLLQPRLQARAH